MVGYKARELQTKELKHMPSTSYKNASLPRPFDQTSMN